MERWRGTSGELVAMTRGDMDSRKTWWAALAWLALVVSGCSVEPVANAEPAGCTSTCTEGETRCDGDSVQECVENEEGCFAFEGEPLACPGGQVCQGGSCKREDQVGCADECSIDQPTQCNTSGQVESCADHDDDGCLEYGGASECGPEEICDAATGQCKAVNCQDACVEGETQCDGRNLQTCRTSAEGCLAFVGGKDCGEGRTCTNGACTNATVCTTECVDGERVCTPEGGVRSCADDDNDGCATFQPPSECRDSQVCRGGECVTASSCEDACKAGEKACRGNQIAVCKDSDNDGCTDFGDVSDCPGAGQSCSAQGQVRCEAPPQATAQVVINEVFYDRYGPEVDDRGRTPNFIELLGTPGANLAGFRLRLVNGRDGTNYKIYRLPAGARLDGNGYALIVPKAVISPPYFLFVAPSNTNLYHLLESYAPANSTLQADTLQNGPDSIVLEDITGTEVDALGYGTFGAGDTFAGEGTAADRTTHGRSLGRVPGAADTNNNRADFVSYVPTPGLPNSDLVINEIYVDQPGTDNSAETFIEIGPPTQFNETLSLQGYTLHAIDGGSGMEYIFTGQFPGILLDNLTDKLESTSGKEPYLVVCHSDNVSATLLNACNAFWEGDDFQNGPDSLVLRLRGRQVDAVAYGSFSSGSTTAVGEGSPAPAPVVGRSLARWPLGSGRLKDTDDNSKDFHRVSPTPGRDNPVP